MGVDNTGSPGYAAPVRPIKPARFRGKPSACPDVSAAKRRNVCPAEQTTRYPRKRNRGSWPGRLRLQEGRHVGRRTLRNFYLRQVPPTWGYVISWGAAYGRCKFASRWPARASTIVSSPLQETNVGPP